ncbi:hypothetical protein PRIPAC_96828 [Pristionchus pacificus]|uniref:Uncharacterized protein n=1 Tax=Pristionchus pacificus TaxID=54126 RepID=A0A2A6BD07_PRIPA|nr:hypothetical protein PRIPAC_96828 [Pristionchus pacificus]|eukprot:PDM63765.1 hypothetical protein PRIPAC_49738 [Pristionchus pacificus]
MEKVTTTEYQNGVAGERKSESPVVSTPFRLRKEEENRRKKGERTRVNLDKSEQGRNCDGTEEKKSRRKRKPRRRRRDSENERGRGEEEETEERS